MSNEGVADSAECFSAVAEDDIGTVDDGYGNFSSLKEEINSSERTESYRTFGPDYTRFGASIWCWQPAQIGPHPDTYEVVVSFVGEEMV